MFFFRRKGESTMTIDLITTRGEQLLTEGTTPWQVYPRPQMRRESYLNLNGHWKFTAPGHEANILVPFCPESQLSLPVYGGAVQIQCQ